MVSYTNPLAGDSGHDVVFNMIGTLSMAAVTVLGGILHSVPGSVVYIFTILIRQGSKKIDGREFKWGHKVTIIGIAAANMVMWIVELGVCYCWVFQKYSKMG